MPPLGRLIWIGRSPDGNLFALPNFFQIAAQEPRGLILDEYFVLELIGIADLHELVRVARIAVLAGELATAIGIDSPRERKIATRVAAVEDRAHRQREEFNLMPAIDVLGLTSQLGDADQMGLWLRWI